MLGLGGWGIIDQGAKRRHFLRTATISIWSISNVRVGVIGISIVVLLLPVVIIIVTVHLRPTVRCVGFQLTHWISS